MKLIIKNFITVKKIHIYYSGHYFYFSNYICNKLNFVKSEIRYFVWKLLVSGIHEKKLYDFNDNWNILKSVI